MRGKGVEPLYYPWQGYMLPLHQPRSYYTYDSMYLNLLNFDAEYGIQTRVRPVTGVYDSSLHQFGRSMDLS